MTQSLRRIQNTCDVEDILCDSLTDDMPDNHDAELRLLIQGKVNCTEFVTMSDHILTVKEQDEHEEQAEQKLAFNMDQ